MNFCLVGLCIVCGFIFVPNQKKNGAKNSLIFFGAAFSEINLSTPLPPGGGGGARGALNRRGIEQTGRQETKGDNSTKDPNPNVAIICTASRTDFFWFVGPPCSRGQEGWGNGLLVPDGSHRGRCLRLELEKKLPPGCSALRLLSVAPPDADDDDGDAAAEVLPPIDLRGIAAAFWDEASRPRSGDGTSPPPVTPLIAPTSLVEDDDGFLLLTHVQSAPPPGFTAHHRCCSAVVVWSRQVLT